MCSCFDKSRKNKGSFIFDSKITNIPETIIIGIRKGMLILKKLDNAKLSDKIETSVRKKPIDACCNPFRLK